MLYYKHGRTGNRKGKIKMKIYGINDEVTTCECCGRKNLKRTIVLGDDEGNTVHYGSDCAAHALMGKKSKGNAAIVTSQATAIKFATVWLKKYTPFEVAGFVGAKFGYSAGMVQGTFRIGDFAEIKI